MNTQCFTYLTYGPCRPETRLAVGVKIQTENATHLVSQTESAALIAWTATIRKFLSNEFRFGLYPPREKSLKYRTRCVFHTPTQRTTETMRLSSLQSPKVVGVEESAPSATAPCGVQLQELINWMLRFHVGNPREFHHLRLKGVRWRHQRLPRISEA